MISLAPTNVVALQLLQSRGSNDGPQLASTGSDVLKVANGISAESSAGTKSAAAAIGRFAIDSAPSTSAASGKIVIGDLGSFDTWDQAVAYVNGNETFSANQKKDWLEKIAGFQESFEHVEKFKASDLYQSFMSGALREEWLAIQEANKEGLGLTAEHVRSMDNVLSSLGRETLTESLSRARNDILPK